MVSRITHVDHLLETDDCSGRYQEYSKTIPPLTTEWSKEQLDAELKLADWADYCEAQLEKICQ